jgi:hypothetical protein
MQRIYLRSDRWRCIHVSLAFPLPPQRRRVNTAAAAGANGLRVSREDSSRSQNWPFCRAVLSSGSPEVRAYAREQGMLWSACA